MIVTEGMIAAFWEKGFVKDPWEFVEGDVKVEVYRGFEIGLCIPNGGILGVSFHHNREGFSLLTDGVDDLPSFEDRDEHIALAKAAIDAALGPVPDQLCLVEG